MSILARPRARRRWTWIAAAACIAIGVAAVVTAPGPRTVWIADQPGDAELATWKTTDGDPAARITGDTFLVDCRRPVEPSIVERLQACLQGLEAQSQSRVVCVSTGRTRAGVGVMEREFAIDRSPLASSRRERLEFELAALRTECVQRSLATARGGPAHHPDPATETGGHVRPPRTDTSRSVADALEVPPGADAGGALPAGRR